MNTTYKFSTEETARNFANRANDLMVILLGDDEKYWVTTFANGQRLEKQGYEIIK